MALLILLGRLWSKRVTQKYALVITAASFVGVLGAIPTVLQVMDDRVTAYVVDTSVRGLMYESSLELARQRAPFGTGAGTFGSQPTRTLYFSPLYHSTGLSEHYGANEIYSDYLMDTWWPKILAEAGFAGFALYAGFLLLMLVRAIKVFRSSASSEAVFALITGATVVSSSIGSALFTSDVGLLLVAAFCTAVAVLPPTPKVRRLPNQDHLTMRASL
ncbi:O-antigen ligase family protein [Ramlibacter sp. MMS24-I3-19]|uniref:O-antigen ligase family protein n=1 Tax=Ramlibacter sp. MMS24-I3-19 TaxID=3416606 RepID=UPI003CFD0458